MSRPDYLGFVESNLDWVGIDAQSSARRAKKALFYARRTGVPDFQTRAEAQISRAENALRAALNDLQAVRESLRPTTILEAAE